MREWRVKLSGWMPGAWSCRIPVALGTGPQKQHLTPFLKTLKYSAGHCAEGCHLRVTYKKPKKLFDVSAFLLIQIINKKINFWTKFLLLSGTEMISLKVSCSLFRYFCTICHIPKLASWKRIGVTFLNLFSTNSIAWDSQMWAVALRNPQTVRRNRQMTAQYRQTPFVPRSYLPEIIIPSLTCVEASACRCAEHFCLDAGSPKPESPSMVFCWALPPARRRDLEHGPWGFMFLAVAAVIFAHAK